MQCRWGMFGLKIVPKTLTSSSENIEPIKHFPAQKQQ